MPGKSKPAAPVKEIPAVDVSWEAHKVLLSCIMVQGFLEGITPLHTAHLKDLDTKIHNQASPSALASSRITTSTNNIPDMTTPPGSETPPLACSTLERH